MSSRFPKCIVEREKCFKEIFGFLVREDNSFGREVRVVIEDYLVFQIEVQGTN